MTDEVAALVLRHNYAQNMALTTARSQAPNLLHVHARYLRQLERDKRLRRGQEAVPGEREIAERRSAGKGLTNPELALLLAHTKIGAGEEVLASGLADDPYLRRELTGYFPAPLRASQAGRMQAHPLRHEIITTSVVNEMVDTSGTTFAFRLNEETGASVPDITRAWLVARANQLWAPADNDPDGARRCMRRFYGLLKISYGEPRDVAEAARLEVDWWRVHRQRQHTVQPSGGDPADELVGALTRLYSFLYGEPDDAVRPAAVHRTEAMDLSDRWVAEGCRPDSPLLAREHAALVRCYAALLAAVHH